MAVAVKNTPDRQASSAPWSLVPASIAGAVYILACAAVIFWGVPALWSVGVHAYLSNLSFVSYAVLILIECVAIGVLAFLGAALVGPAPPRGLRAGVFTVLAWLVATGLITLGFGHLFEGWFKGGAATIGAALTAAVGVGLLVWGWVLANKPKAADWLRAFDAQGWFSADRLKPSQGQRVRRVTMLGIIALVAAGIWAMYNSGTLTTGARNWTIHVPFAPERFIPILPDVRFTVPLLVAAAGLWLAFRVVNLPVFADFLIATEAELNKVSWPTRKSVVQDTVVVLTTVLLLTLFLFTVDLAWGWLLSRPVVGVLRVQQQTAPQQQQTTEQAPW